MSFRFVLARLSIGLALLLTATQLGCFEFLPTGGDNTGGNNGGGTPPPPEKTLHEKFLTQIIPAGYQGPATCQVCHSAIARDLLQTAHWKWRGTSVSIVGQETGTHGKRDLLNSFFIGVPANEGRCSQCHPSYGWRDKSFDFSSPANIDCLICHDTTGTYEKHPTDGGGGGAPALKINGQLTVVGPADLQSVVYNVGKPTRRNCGFCHFYADGGDNVKQGTLSSALVNPTREMDVHMGGLNFVCQTCHAEHDHGIAGFSLHSVDEGGAQPNCTRCHGSTKVHTRNVVTNDLLNLHLDRVACETCHIPTFARTLPTQTAWYWDEAGDANRVVTTDPYGKPTYDKMKGRLVWAKDVKPTYRWYNGQWKRMIIGVSDTYTNAGTEQDPVVLAEPVATKNDPDAKIYPFKKMIGRQPADTVNRRLIVPHLFGQPGGANPYWSVYDWGLAIQEGAAYSGVPYSGTYGFPNTVMYLRVSHEIAPKERALLCNNCHGVPEFWTAVDLEDPLAFP